MITFEIIQKVWQMLGEPQVFNQIAAHQLDMIETPLGHPLITIDTDGRRHLLIPISGESYPVEDRQSAGVHITSNEWGYEGERQRYIDVICLKFHLNGIFDLMLLDILTALPEDYDYPDRVCRRVLNRWREFLTPEPRRLPDKTKLVGVWGELWILEQLARRDASVIKIWTGPDGGRFDFFNLKAALEVKTTLQRKGMTPTINGHDQMEPPSDGQLFFALLKVEERPVGGFSIPDLIDQLVEDGIERRQILTSLLKVGISPDIIPNSADLRLHLNEWLLYKVDEQFPKITTSSFKGDMLPNGVISMTYQIDLSTQPPYPLSEQLKEQFLNQFAGEM